MKQNSRQRASTILIAEPRPAYIVEISASRLIDDGKTPPLEDGPALLLELAPSMQRVLLNRQRLELNFGLMSRGREKIGLVILRAGRHVSIIAMDCGDVEVARLLKASKGQQHLRVLLMGNEYRQLETFDLDGNMVRIINRLTDAIPMQIERYISMARSAVAETCSPAGMAAAGLDPRRVRSIDVFAHIGNALIDQIQQVFEQQVPEQQSLFVH